MKIEGHKDQKSSIPPEFPESMQWIPVPEKSPVPRAPQDSQHLQVVDQVLNLPQQGDLQSNTHHLHACPIYPGATSKYQGMR
jgi:hypothetical protein